MERLRNRREVVKQFTAAAALTLGMEQTYTGVAHAEEITTEADKNITLFENVDVQTLITEAPNFTPVTDSYSTITVPNLTTPAELETIPVADQLLMKIAVSEMTPPDNGNKIVIHGLQVMCVGDEYQILGCDVKRSRIEFNPDMKFTPDSI